MGAELLGYISQVDKLFPEAADFDSLIQKISLLYPPTNVSVMLSDLESFGFYWEKTDEEVEKNIRNSESYQKIYEKSGLDRPVIFRSIYDLIHRSYIGELIIAYNTEFDLADESFRAVDL